MNATLLAITTSDERLWRAVVLGDTSAFQTVVERYQGAVAGVAFNVLGEFAASQDIAQETFWTAWKSRAQLREPARLGGWLCGIARNLAHEWVRKHRHASAPTEDALLRDSISREPDPAEQSISSEEQALVWSSLEDLAENYREVLILYYRQGRSIAEVAVALDLSEDAVKQRLSRGREMLRVQLATVVEDVLVRSRPGRNFTGKVMAGLIGVGSALGTASTASAASLSGKIAGGALSGTAATVTKSLLASSSAAGLAGGLAGAAGGLGGAWLGTWLPAQLAPTLTERRLLEQSGRQMFRIGVGYTALILILTPMLFFGWQLAYFLTIAAATLVFVCYTVVASLRVQRAVAKVRQTIRPEEDPNPSAVKAQLDRLHVTGPSGWQGRSYTSSLRCLGWPLLDVQISDPDVNRRGLPPRTQIAQGWIAIGDRAHGILLGIGGRARGLVAMGGIAYGFLALGGLSLGVVSMGGLAIGLLALGGGAIGHTAIGGGAAGWDSAGGLAVGWHSAAGGLAAANHVAVGGLAVASHFAVGGQAFAAQSNTPAAQQAVLDDSLKWTLDWYQQNSLGVLVAILLVAISPMALVPFYYRRGKGVRKAP